MLGKGTTDAIFLGQQLQDRILRDKKASFYAPVDLEKAFD